MRKRERERKPQERNNDRIHRGCPFALFARFHFKINPRGPVLHAVQAWKCRLRYCALTSNGAKIEDKAQTHMDVSCSHSLL